MTGDDLPDATALTRSDNYFEAFEAGDVFRHARGKTLSEDEMHSVTHMTMNTAEAHFNEDKMAGREQGGRINYGGLTMSIVLGLASEDTTENAHRVVGLDEIRFHRPVWPGDTLYAVTEVLETVADPGDVDELAEVDELADADEPAAGSGDATADCGYVRFKHYGIDADENFVFSGVQRCLLRKRPTKTRIS